MATAKKKTETKIPLAQEIWERIKDIDLELFALPDQTVEVNAFLGPTISLDVKGQVSVLLGIRVGL